LAPGNSLPSDPMATQRTPSGSQIKSVARALTVIEALSAHREGATLTALARELSLPKGSVFRVLRTLRDFGYVRQDPLTERYALGTRFLRIAASVEQGTDIRAIAHPLLVRLSESIAETVHLAVPEGEHMVYIDKVESPRAVVMASRVGQQLPLHCSALGKSYLSALPLDERRAIVSALRLERRTARTIVDPAALLEDLEACVERGFAIDNLENEDGLRCVGAAIVDGRGQAVAAVSVSAPASRFSLSTVRKAGRRCAELAEEISAALGA
jgi:DNA-binding IclR family transcriptional regulator